MSYVLLASFSLFLTTFDLSEVFESLLPTWDDSVQKKNCAFEYQKKKKKLPRKLPLKNKLYEWNFMRFLVTNRNCVQGQAWTLDLIAVLGTHPYLVLSENDTDVNEIKFGEHKTHIPFDVWQELLQVWVVLEMSTNSLPHHGVLSHEHHCKENTEVNHRETGPGYSFHFSGGTKEIMCILRYKVISGVQMHA